MENIAENINIMKNDAFKVEILSLPFVSLFTQSIDLPGVILGEALRPNPNIDYAVPGDTLDFENFIMTFMVDENLKNYFEILHWLFGLGFPRHTDEFVNLIENTTFKEKSDIKIQLNTNKNNYNIELTLVDAFPISLSSIQLSYTETQPSHPIATVEFQFTYLYYGAKPNSFFNNY